MRKVLIGSTVLIAATMFVSPARADETYRCEVTWQKKREAAGQYQKATLFESASARHVAEQQVADRYTANGNEYVSVTCRDINPD
jgi:hypothetical protein